MITLSWTSSLTAADDPRHSAIGRQRIWDELLSKAENPVDYVPAITDCRIIERYSDGFLREIVRDGEKLVQRVSWDAVGRIVFEHVDDPDVASIANVVRTDADGRLTFTIEVELAPDGERRVLAQSELLRGLDAYFTPTLGAIVDALRPAITRS